MENTCDDHQPPPLPLLPQDALVQILVFLPVISLLRFKSVCKSWRALIQSSFFIDLHLNTLPIDNYSSYSSKFGTFIFQTLHDDFMSKRMESEAFMLSRGSGGGDGDGDGDGEVDEFEDLKLEDLGFPCKVSTNEILMVGSCNGLICLHDAKRKDVSLWNPATRQFRLLPKPLALAGIGDLVQDFVAFGYDVKTKDYKVIQVSHFRPYMSNDCWLSAEEYIFRVQVYNLSRDSWRLLEGIDSLPARPQQGLGMNHGVSLNGSYYFLGKYCIETEVEHETGTVTQATNYDMILSFDFTKEIFTTIQFPHDYYLTTISTYLGKLAVFARVIKCESDFNNYDIWVLNEHDVKESWTNLHSLGPYFSESETVIPRGISNNGEFAFIAIQGNSLINGEFAFVFDRMQVFNLVTKEVKKEFRTGHGVVRADVYKQSLVSIGGNGAAADRVIGGAI